MENYIHLPISDYNNLDNIININLKLELIKNTVLNNKNIKFELYSNDEPKIQNIKNKKRKKEYVNNISFYMKVTDNITVENNNIVDLSCNICYEIKLPSNFKILKCNHKLCNLCYNDWCNNCNNVNVSCPYCRSIIC